MNRIVSAVSRLALFCCLALPLSGQQLEVRFLDVGQADAILVREGGKSALIDAGSGAGTLAQLRALGVDTIDLLVASHNHADHIGGMTAVLSGPVVRFYLGNGVPHIQARRDGSYIVLNERSGAPAPTAGAADPGAAPRGSRACCRVCTRGKACGNSCINRGYQCRQPPGCACGAKP